VGAEFAGPGMTDHKVAIAIENAVPGKYDGPGHIEGCK